MSESVVYNVYPPKWSLYYALREDHQIWSTLSDKATCFRHEGDLQMAKYSDFDIFDIESVAQASNSVANFESPHDTTHRDGLEPKGKDEEKS